MAKKKEKPDETIEENGASNIETNDNDSERKEPQKRTVVLDSAEYWNFEENPEFVGKFVSDWQSDNGEYSGYICQDVETDEHFIIPNNHTIEKAMEGDFQSNGALKDQGLTIFITFLGKIKKTDGKEFNKYRIEVA